MTAIVELHDAVTQGFTQVDIRLGRLETRVGRLETQVGRLETRVTSIEGEIKGIGHWMSRADQRLASLEAR